MQIITEHGIDSPDPHIRFRIIQSIPDLVVDNFQKNVNVGRPAPDGIDREMLFVPEKDRVLLTAQPSFAKLIEKLLQKSKSDRTESIRIEAQTTLRAIFRKLNNAEQEIPYLLDSLNRSQIG